MNKILLIIVILSCTFNCYSQQELWGVNRGNQNAPGYNGNITKYDINGQNPTVVHEFLDIDTGKTPKGKLFLASNGKLYGITAAGGNTSGNGVLYEYDLIFDKYRVVHYFDIQASGYIYGAGVIEPVTGKLYGIVSNKVFSFDLITETFTYLTGAAGNSIDSELFKASNGFLYCTTRDSFCPGANSVGPNNFGTVIKVNITANSIQQVYQLPCDGSKGIRFSGEFIETTLGKLINITEGGGSAVPGDGTVYEFDINTNTFTKKIEFDGDNLGSGPQATFSGDNGKLYGVCLNGGVTYVTLNDVTYTEHRGTLFEYAPATNTITKLHDFGNQQNPLNYFTGANPNYIMRASSGSYFGLSSFGVFQFNPVDNSVIMPTPVGTTLPPNANATESLIEICRKPSYHEFDADTFNPCENTPFSFDVQNTNATSYVWKKDGEVVPLQATGVLNFLNITFADSGNYTCEMTNECGTTVTMPLHITVGCVGIDEMAAYKNLIAVYPNPARDVLNIKLPENSNLNVTGCTVFNMLGQIVFESNGEVSQVETANYATGIYSIVLKTDKGSWFGKFIKE